jgi:hypothetical protein
VAKTEQNLKASEEFIRKVLSDNFQQSVDAERLRNAAEKLCSALPERERIAA